MITKRQKIYKRTLDLMIAFLGLLILGIPIFVLVSVVYVRTRECGFFIQRRIGENGKVFSIIKIKTIYSSSKLKGFSSFLRRTKIDEFPQLVNVIKGDMSIVGPRPDVEGFADVLKGNERIILEVKPGLTGPASLMFYNEEFVLNNQTGCKKDMIEKIWREKVRLNMMYVMNYSFFDDLKYIILTLLLLIDVSQNFNSLQSTIVKEDLY